MGIMDKGRDYTKYRLEFMRMSDNKLKLARAWLREHPDSYSDEYIMALADVMTDRGLEGGS